MKCQKKILNFLTLFLMQFLLVLENITFLVMIGYMVSMIKVWLVFKFKFSTMIVFFLENYGLESNLY